MKLYDTIPVICDIKQINPELIKKYLISHHWECIHTYPDGVSTLWEKKGKSVRHIPNQNLYSDYCRILSFALQTIAKTDRILLSDLIKKIDSSVEVKVGYGK